MKSIGSILLILMLVIPASAVAAEQVVGEFIVARGGVELQRKTDGSKHTPSVGDKIFLNDRILTSANGFAKLLLKDKSILKVSPSSQLTVSIELVGPQDSNTTINLLRGKLRALVVEKVGANSKYEVHTPVAVAGVRGTDFEVASQDNTTVRCFSGHVEITNIDSAVKGSVLLGPNTYTTVNKGLPPGNPLPMPPGYGNNRNGNSGANRDGGLDQSDIQQIIADITDQTLDGILDDGLNPIAGSDRYIDPILEGPLYGDNIEGRIDQIPDIGTHIPFIITIPTP